MKYNFNKQQKIEPVQLNPGDKAHKNMCINFSLCSITSERRATWRQEVTQSTTLSRETETTSALSSSAKMAFK